MGVLHDKRVQVLETSARQDAQGVHPVSHRVCSFRGHPRRFLGAPETWDEWVDGTQDSPWQEAALWEGTGGLDKATRQSRGACSDTSLEARSTHRTQRQVHLPVGRQGHR